jgi:hypothetical protein
MISSGGFFVQDEIDAETEDFVRLENKIPNIPPQYSRLRLEAILLIVPKFFMFPVPVSPPQTIINGSSAYKEIRSDTRQKLPMNSGVGAI